MVATACSSGPRRQFTDADYPGVLREPSAFRQDVQWRQHVSATWGDGVQRGFDAAMMKNGDSLVVASLSPMGGIGFAITLRGTTIEMQNNGPEELPFPPRFILLDVQRAFYPWLPGSGGARSDGQHEAIVDGEHVVESWLDGRLMERRFARVDGQPRGTIAIRYQWDRADWIAPVRTVMDNGWFGYRLTVETLEETLLEP